MNISPDEIPVLLLAIGLFLFGIAGAADMRNLRRRDRQLTEEINYLRADVEGLAVNQGEWFRDVRDIELSVGHAQTLVLELKNRVELIDASPADVDYVDAFRQLIERAADILDRADAGIAQAYRDERESKKSKAIQNVKRTGLFG